MYVGMPASLYLDEFGSQVWAAFGHPPYVVGSALHKKDWRDIDVRLILPDDEWTAQGFPDPSQVHRCGKWTSLCMAYAALGKHITGLPIDFQIQQQTNANATYTGIRSAIGLTPLRLVGYPILENSPDSLDSSLVELEEAQLQEMREDLTIPASILKTDP